MTDTGHRSKIVAGFGFRESASVDSLRDAFRQCADHALVDALATADDKVNARAFVALLQELGMTGYSVDPAAIQATPTLTQAPKVIETRGTGSVAEACALVVAGPNAVLLAPRHISQDRMATCAIAKGEPS